MILNVSKIPHSQWSKDKIEECHIRYGEIIDYKYENKYYKSINEEKDDILADLISKYMFTPSDEFKFMLIDDNINDLIFMIKLYNLCCFNNVRIVDKDLRIL